MLRAMFSNKKLAQLLATGVVALGELDEAQKGGDYVNVPRVNLSADFARIDVTATSGASFTDVATTDDKAVVLRDYSGDKYSKADLARSGEQLGLLVSASVGEKLAKRILQQFARMTSAVIDQIDTPSADYHTLDATSNALTLNYFRQGRQKMRDAADDLNTCWIHSQVWGDLMYDLYTNYKVDVVGGVLINNGRLESILGIGNFVISDLSTNSGVGTGTTTDDRYHTILLGPGAIQLAFQKDVDTESDSDIDAPSSRIKVKHTVHYILHPKGMKWNSTANPTDAAYGTNSNWDEAYEDHRQVKLVKIISNGGVN